MKNRDLFLRDPSSHPIPNDGVSKLAEKRFEVLRWELENFVCTGEYEKGLKQILGHFLEGEKSGSQPGIWISGFYGSGKSHLVRVLQHLWINGELPDKSTPQGLVRLPQSVTDHLRELKTVGLREGGVWAAAGELNDGPASESVRLAFLRVVLTAAGLPGDLTTARFVDWLRREGYLDGVQAAVRASGREWLDELRTFSVSSVILGSLMDQAKLLGKTEQEIKKKLQDEFVSSAADISEEEFLGILRGVLEMQSAKAGHIPATLIILDETSAYLQDDPVRLAAFQGVIQTCSTAFDGLVLVVCTAQMSLQATSALQKLKGRFRREIALADSDIESVVLQVVLQKRPGELEPLRAFLESVSGEISRHLRGSKVQWTGQGDARLAEWYPVLPAHRRFWELVLRAIDREGGFGVLRTQLKLIHEAAVSVAEQDMGHVVAGDFVFDQQETALMSTHMVSRETLQTIRDLRDGTPEGNLRARLLALSVLISRLPRESGSDSGIRATAEALADLLVVDLTTPSMELRGQVKGVLDTMTSEGLLDRVGEEFKPPNPVSTEWLQDFSKRLASLSGNAGRLFSDRDRLFEMLVKAEIDKVKLTQGNSQVARRHTFAYGSVPPDSDGVAVPIWVQDGWETTETAVRAHAKSQGVDSELIMVFIPKVQPTALNSALAGVAAARETLAARPIPTTAEGHEAKASMETRLAEAEKTLDGLARQILAGTKVFQGGGNEMTAASLAAALRLACEASLLRLFPQFDVADNNEWAKVPELAREGNADPLKPVGGVGDVMQHPVCSEVLAFLPPEGARGAAVRDHFAKSPHGWSQDAVVGALFGLAAAGAVTTRLNGNLVKVAMLSPASAVKADFVPEASPVPVSMLLEVRSLVAKASIQATAGDEEAALQRYLDALLRLAGDSGGAPPLPEVPDTTLIRSLQVLTGNKLIASAHAKAGELESLWNEWRRQAELVEARLPSWKRLEQLFELVPSLASEEHFVNEMIAVREGRRLVDMPDPVTPLLSRACDIARAELGAASSAYFGRRDAALASLGDDHSWTRLDGEVQQRILEDVRLMSAPPAPHVGTDDEILESLRQVKLDEWRERCVALDERLRQARERAIKHLEPKAETFSPRSATLGSSGEVEEYVKLLRRDLLALVEKGPVII